MEACHQQAAQHGLHTDRAARWTHGGAVMVRLLFSFRLFRHPPGG